MFSLFAARTPIRLPLLPSRYSFRVPTWTLPVAGILAVTASCSAGTIGPGAVANGQIKTLKVMSGGISRTFSVYMPVRAPAKRAALIAFHGAGSNGISMRIMMDIERIADRTGTVVVYPEAAPNTQRTWALGCTKCTWADAAGVNDYLFVADLIDTLVKVHGVDRSKIFAAGFSLGGSFVHNLACRSGGRVAGIVVVSAAPSADELPACSPTRRIPVLILLGDADPHVPWDGGGKFAYLPVEELARTWAQWDSCSGGPDSSAVAPASGAPAGAKVLTYSHCPDGNFVRLYRLTGVGHVWPADDFSVSTLIGEQLLARGRND